jgi:hypothetical protein
VIPERSNRQFFGDDGERLSAGVLRIDARGNEHDHEGTNQRRHPQIIGCAFRVRVHCLRSSQKQNIANEEVQIGFEMRIGYGWDSHEFKRGVPLKIGGVEIEHPEGLGGHSDGDVLLHAITHAGKVRTQRYS